MSDIDIIVDEQYVAGLFPQFESALCRFIAEHARLKQFKAGDILMQTGQYMKATVLITAGRVKLYRQGEDGGEFFMYYLEAGNACALSMICATKQETSEVMAKAVEDTTALMIPISYMDNLMRQYKTWYYFVLETYRARFEELLTVIDDVAFRSMDERLFFYLQKQHRQLKSRELKISHSEIAADLNSSREVISRLLKKMEQRGDVKLHRNAIEWLGPDDV
ncbi:Crp/Fnr family transcriptional regulator [Mucilaginibacter sp. RS28]|uniref:Crp/Fnr family transcriptional regulator n=1 Tax=Mucilaginibacter straminoryzae TaxID=2932774 RepID=A0A9X1X036_9SPHI|nr:Crp/Fnr family transcriptional regulator [Mucilaginibacter straminoryzae]MCJ8208583.1 Crp/Fnr family transcriptional regulator [Mucilaginibacter straminoryzae]